MLSSAWHDLVDPYAHDFILQKRKTVTISQPSLLNAWFGLKSMLHAVMAGASVPLDGVCRAGSSS